MHSVFDMDLSTAHHCFATMWWLKTASLNCSPNMRLWYFPLTDPKVSFLSFVNIYNDISVQFRSVAQSCPTLCDPMNRSTPGLPVHHQHPEFTQTHVHRVSDAIQPSHPLLSPSPPATNPSQPQSFSMSQLFAWGSQNIGVSALASVPPKNTQNWSPLQWTSWISLQS